MPRWVERKWQPGAAAAGLSRKDRQSGKYQAFVPDTLGHSLPELSGEAQSAAADAQAVLARVDERIGSTGFLNHLLIRSESISSSWIEGNRVTPKRLAIAEVLHHGPRVALDVVDNVRATEQAIAELADTTHTVTIADIENLQHIIEPRLKPGIRHEQNWVGGPGWSPLRAQFVPPPEDCVPELLADLASFVTATSGNPIVRAAVAHAQFETIHPFVDGNGRTGRALIHTILRRTDTLRNVLLPISTVFAGNTDAYIAGLDGFRSQPQRLDDWVISFSLAAEAAAGNAAHLASRVEQVGEQLTDQLVAFRREQGRNPARPRRDALVWKVLQALPGKPVQTGESVTEDFGASPASAHRALAELGEAGILRRTKDKKGREICWTADSYLALVSLAERSNSVGGGDTRDNRPDLAPAAPEWEIHGDLWA